MHAELYRHSNIAAPSAAEILKREAAREAMDEAIAAQAAKNAQATVVRTAYLATYQADGSIKMVPETLGA